MYFSIRHRERVLKRDHTANQIKRNLAILYTLAAIAFMVLVVVTIIVGASSLSQ